MQATATTTVPRRLTPVVTTVYPITAMMSDFLNRTQQSRPFPSEGKRFRLEAQTSAFVDVCTCNTGNKAPHTAIGVWRHDTDAGYHSGQLAAQRP
jgi:hypothetical protein